MPPSDDPHAGLLTGFLDGDARSQLRLVQQLGPWLARLAERMAPHDFRTRGLIDDVVNRTWELLVRRPAGAFDPTRGTAKMYLTGLLRNAVRDVRDASRRVVGPARDYTVLDLTDDASQKSRSAILAAGSLDKSFDTVDNMLWLDSIRADSEVGRAVTALAFTDEPFNAVAEAVGLSRFVLKRRLVRWAEKELVAAAS